MADATETCLTCDGTGEVWLGSQPYGSPGESYGPCPDCQPQRGAVECCPICVSPGLWSKPPSGPVTWRVFREGMLVHEEALPPGEPLVVRREWAGGRITVCECVKE